MITKLTLSLLIGEVNFSLFDFDITNIFLLVRLAVVAGIMNHYLTKP